MHSSDYLKKDYALRQYLTVVVDSTM